jgi:hypothetical protein
MPAVVTLQHPFAILRQPVAVGCQPTGFGLLLVCYQLGQDEQSTTSERLFQLSKKSILILKQLKLFLGSYRKLGTPPALSVRHGA